MPSYHILFDGNNFVSKIRFATISELYKAKWKKMDTVFFDKESECQAFYDNLNSGVKGFLSNFPSYDQVIFCQDSRSWRKQLILDGGRKYKENRKDDGRTNYQKQTELIDRFLEENKKILFSSKLPNAEADDLIYFWKKYITEKKKDPYIFIVTSDNDFHQLLDERTFMANHLKDYKKIETHLEFKAPKTPEVSLDMDIFDEEETDIFDYSGTSYSNNDMNWYDYYKKLKNRFDFSKVSENEKLVYKLFCGEDSDGIPSCYNFEEKGRITPKYIKHIIEVLGIDANNINPKDLIKDSYLERIVPLFETMSKKDIEYDRLKKNLKNNYVMIFLNDSAVPSKLYENFLNQIGS